MLEPVKHILCNPQLTRLVLASGSPRRREILSVNANLHGCFEIFPSSCDENLDKTQFKHRPWKFAEEIARMKAEEVFERLSRDHDDRRLIVVGSDTVVTFNDEIYGKPKNENDAFQMLRSFSGHSQKVYTGVTIMASSGNKGHSDKCEIVEKTFNEVTTVNFDDLSDDVIRGYIATGEPMDKAGGYGIQAIGGSLIRSIEGDYFNVMGFPVNKFCKELSSLI